MSKHIKAICRVLQEKQNITKHSFTAFVHDAKIPLALRKKVALYFKGDKRVSKDKLLAALQATALRYPQKQKGGVGDNCLFPVYNGILRDVRADKAPPAFTFGVPLQVSMSQLFKKPPENNSTKPEVVGVNILKLHCVAETNENKGASTPGSPKPLFVESMNGNRYDLGDSIGSGGMADVYDITGTQFVAKVFKRPGNMTDDQYNTMVTDSITNISKFLENFSDIVNKTSFHTTKSTEMIITSNDQKTGYLMLKMKDSLDKLIDIDENKINTLSSYINTSIRILLDTEKSTRILLDTEKSTPPRLIHGDIKLANILYQDATQANILPKVVLHDFDGVYMYNPDTLLPLDYSFENGYQREIHCTISSTHPFFLYYKHIAVKPGISETGIFSQLQSNAKLHFAFWKAAIAAINTNDQFKKVVVDLVNKFIGADYHLKVLNLLSQQSDITRGFTESPLQAWVKSILLKCDQYSLGMSILVHCTLKISQTEPDGREQIKTLLKPVMLRASEIVNESLLPSESLLPQDGGTPTTSSKSSSVTSQSPPISRAYVASCRNKSTIPTLASSIPASQFIRRNEQQKSINTIQGTTSTATTFLNKNCVVSYENIVDEIFKMIPDHDFQLNIEDNAVLESVVLCQKDTIIMDQTDDPDRRNYITLFGGDAADQEYDQLRKWFAKN